MKLTQANVTKAKLPAGKGEGFHWDDEMPGFGLRLRDSGSRTFVVQYKIGAKHRRVTLGNAGKVTAEDARKRAKQIFGKVADGKDPANEKAIRKAEASTTLGTAVEVFLRWFDGRVRPRTFEETARYLRQHWKPLHGMAVAHIARANIAAEASAIAQRSGPVAADRARSALSQFFAWAMGEGLRDDNPVIGTNKAAPSVRRERVLSDAEVRTIWNGTDPATDYGKIVRLLFLTACRRDEIGGLRVAEIALGDSLIALPGSRTKNGLPHDVPLSGLAKGIVESLQTEGRTFAFGRLDTGFSGWSKAKAETDAALKINEAWTLHDIRRTVATRMGDLGIQPHVVEAVLNHISGSKAGVAGTYNRSVYAKEKREALATWAAHLATLTRAAGKAKQVKQ